MELPSDSHLELLRLMELYQVWRTVQHTGIVAVSRAIKASAGGLGW